MPEPDKWLVWKFGGTSVANAERLVNVANLVCQQCGISTSSAVTPETKIETPGIRSHLTLDSLHNSDPTPHSTHGSTSFGSDYDASLPGMSGCQTKYRLAVVVSAMAGITDALQSSCDEAAMEFHRHGKYSITHEPRMKHSTARRDPDYYKCLDEIRRRHFETADDLLERNEIELDDADSFKAIHKQELVNISEILKAFSLSGTCPLSLREMVMGHGEIWSSRLLFSIIKRRYCFAFSEDPLNQITKEQEHSASDDITKISPDQPTGGQSTEVGQRLTRVIEEVCPIINEKVPNANGKHPSGIVNGMNVNGTPNGKRDCRVNNGCEFCLPCPIHGLSSACCRSKVVRWIDARQILVIREGGASPGVYEKVTVNFSSSNQNMKNWLDWHSRCRIAVVTGYICSNSAGIPATLKRNGSDYSGSLFAHLLKAKLYTVWTDVDGVYTADPRKVPNAFRLPFLSYIEAIELAYFGAKVIHPLTMEPCISANIPIVLRSSLQPESSGTLIGASLPETPSHSSYEMIQSTARPVSISPSTIELTKLDLLDKKKAMSGYCKAFTLIDNISLINVAGTSMIGVPGIASRLFSAVHEANCSVVMISQASSEHSICFAVLSSQVDRAKAAVEAAFYKEMQHDLSMRVSVTDHCTIICAVGERMCGALGVLGVLSTSLANADVNVKAVTQGASEINITFVVETAQATTAIRAMHDAIYKPPEMFHRVQERSQSYTKEHSRRSQKGSMSFDKETLTETLSNLSQSDKLDDKSDLKSELKQLNVLSMRQTIVPEECIRVLFLIPTIPLSPSVECHVLQIASDIYRQSRDPTPLERRSLPLRIIGYTDGVVFVSKLRASEQAEGSTLQNPSATELLFDRNWNSPLVLVDLRRWTCDLTPGATRFLKTEAQLAPKRSSPASYMTLDELSLFQLRFLQQWKGRGRMVIDTRSIQVAPALDSLFRMIGQSDAQEQNNINIMSSSHPSSELMNIDPNESEDCSTVTSNRTPDMKGRRRAFTTEDL